MSDTSIDLFAEDRAHETFLKALIQRLADEAYKPVTIHVRAARGGHGRAMDELTNYRRLIEKGAVTASDLFVIAIAPIVGG